MADHARRLESLSVERRALLARRLALQPHRVSGPTPLPRADGVETFRTSFAQERVWFLEQIAAARAAYNVAAAFRAVGTLDQTALRRSLAALVARHESLRTTFVAVDGAPRQVVSPLAPLAMAVHDLRGDGPESARLQTASDAIAHDAAKPFDVAHGPLLRVRILRVTDTLQLIGFTMHHLVADGWSLRVFARELSSLYGAASTGAEPPLPTPVLQYADYAEWQRSRYRGDVGAASIEYWRRRLAGAPYPRVPAGDRLGFCGAVAIAELSVATTAAMRELARREAVTLFVVGLAVWQAVVGAWFGDDDVTVLAPVANRDRFEVAEVIGFFVNLVALRTRLDGAPSFRELLRRVQSVVQGALVHQEVPFEMVLKALALDRSLTRPPLSPIAFALEPAATSGLVFPGLELAPLALDTTTAKTDLALILREEGRGLTARLEYNCALYEAAEVGSLLSEFVRHLERVLENPEGRAVPPAPSTLVTEESAASDAPGGSVWTRFVAQAMRTPDAVAVRVGTTTATYRELHWRAARVAANLAGHGIAPEAVVAVHGERGLSWVTAMLGIWCRGAVYLPLDPRWPVARMTQVLRQSGARLVLADRDHAPGLRTATSGAPWTVAAFADDLVAGTAGDPVGATAGSPDREGDALAYVLYTSGSTGRPKGALIDHAGLANHLSAKIALLGLRSGDRVAQTAAASFDVSLWQCCAALLVGARVEMLDDETARDPRSLLNALGARRITVFETVPAMLDLLLATEERAPASGALARLRWLVVTGEALPPELCRRWLRRHPDVPLVNAYGPTECADDVTHHVVRTLPPDDALLVPIGRPIAGMAVHVLDADLRPVPTGEVGELCVSGVGVGRGYLRDPERTAAAFVMLEAEHGGSPTRMYRTGDRGRRRPDGMFEWLGRIDDQVKIRGQRVEPAEVEAVLSVHPAVRQAAVVVASATDGGPAHLVAYVVGGPQEQKQEQDLVGTLRRHVAARLPDVMVPSSIVVCDALPLSSSGKIERQALVPVVARTAEALSARPLATAAERVLAGIWRDVLTVEVRSADDNFFALGGDSLSSIRLVASARRAGLVLTPQQVFEHQTLATLAAVATAAGHAPAAEQGLVVGPVDFTPIQRILLAADLPDLHHYNMTMLVEADEQLSTELLTIATEHVMRHHDALRLRVGRRDGRWEQTFAGVEGPVPVSSVDLAAVSDDDVSSVIEARAAEWQTTLDPIVGPVMRVVAFDLGARRPSRLLVIVHHLACDAVSWPIIMEDLVGIYGALRRGDAIALPAKSTSYRTWAGRLLERATAPERHHELSYWVRACAGTVARLPGGSPDHVPSVADVDERSVALGPDETTRILAAAAAIGVSMESVLVTALATVVTEGEAADGMRVFLERHGRAPLFPDVDVARTVGWFTAVFPLRVRVAPSRRPRDTLALVERQLREIPDDGIGWGLLAHGSDIRTPEAETLRALPRPEISCNYLGRLDHPNVAGWRIARESAGREMGRRGTRPTALDVIAQIVAGRLSVAWYYDRVRLRPDAIEQLSTRFLAVVRALSVAMQSSDRRTS